MARFWEPKKTTICKDEKGNITFPEGRPLITRISEPFVFVNLDFNEPILGESEVLGYIVFKYDVERDTYLAYDNSLLGEIAKGINEALESIRWGFWKALWDAGLLHPEPGFRPRFKDIGIR